MKNKGSFFKKIPPFPVSLWGIPIVDLISTRNLNDEEEAVNEYFG